MWRLPIFFIFTLYMAVAYSQSRMPEIQLPKQTAQPDSTGFEERPYFLLIEQSEQALENNDYEAAALRLVEAMGIEPENPLNVALLSNLGMIYFYDEKDSLALSVLEKVIERSPRLIAPHEFRARVLMLNGRDPEAYKEYAQIIEIDSVNTNARLMHGMMALYNGDMQTARQDFAVLERVIPLARQTHLAMGTYYSMTGDDQKAIPYFKDLIDIEPAAEYYASLAGCYLNTGDLYNAAETLGKAFQKHPDDPELYYYRAWLLRDRFETDEAKADAKRAIELGLNPVKINKLFGK